MLYLFNENAGASGLTLTGDDHRYIFKVRRHKVDETLHLRNLEDGLLHRYRITHIDKRSVMLDLQESITLQVKAKKRLHIGWCMIDPKSVRHKVAILNILKENLITTSLTTQRDIIQTK